MKKGTKFISLIAAAVIITGDPAGISYAEDNLHIQKLLVSEDYEGRTAGEVLWDYGHYNVTVQPDPENPANLTARQTFGTECTEGFLYQKDIDAAEASEGILVVEEEVRFSVRSEGLFEHGIYMRAVDGNNGFVLWNGTNTDLYGMKPENDKWYKVTCALDIDAGKCDVYIQRRDGRLLREADDLGLPGGIDYSKGIYMFYERFVGSSQTDDSIYTDNLCCYKSDMAAMKQKIYAEDEYAQSRETYYSDLLCDTLAGSVVLYIDNPYAYVDNRRCMIDSSDSAVTAHIIDDRTYVPIRFISEKMGYEVEWNGADSSITISGDGKIIQMTVGSKKLINGTEDLILDAAPVIENSRTFVPVRAVSEAFGETVDWYDAGMVVIGGQPLSDTEITELYNARYFVSMPQLPEAEEHKLGVEEAAVRKADFAERNSDAAVAALADELFGMLDKGRPELKTAWMFYNSGQYSRALKAYRAFALDAARKMDEDLWNWSYEYTAAHDAANKKGVFEYADEMLFDIIRSPYGNPLSIGEPGTINWSFNLPQTPEHPGGYSGLQNYMWNDSLYDALFYSFCGTGRIPYLTKWCEYLDDWSMNETSFSELLPPQIPDSHNSNAVASSFIYKLHLLSQILPDDGEGMSETAMARALVKIVREYPIVTVEYMRSNPQNWTTGFFAIMLSTGIELEKLGFDCADYYIRAGLRRAEDFAVTQICADGSETETTLGYLTEYIKYNPVVTALVRKYKPEIADESWYILQEEALNKTADIVIRLLVPGGTYPAGFRDVMVDRASMIEELLKEKAPETLKRAGNQEILDAVRGRADGSGIGYTSVWYPNGGFYSIKDGWTPGSQSGFMYSAPYPYQRATGDNMFVLSAFDRDMLVAGEVGAYDLIRSPMLVDWKNQNATAGRTFWGHRNSMVSASNEYGRYRWLGEGSISFAEGCYSGIYGSGEEAVSDVSHERQISFLRDHGLWIAADRLTGRDNHYYTQKWRIPITPTGNSGRNYKAFDPSEVVLDNTAHTVKTQQENSANMSIYYFSTANLDQWQETENVDASNGYKISDFSVVNTGFNGSGSNILVSLIYPRAGKETELVSVTEKEKDNTEVCGFEAKLKDGSVVEYLAAADKAQVLKCCNIEADCEALLISRSGESVKGLVLSCSRITVDGKEWDPGCSDFEFEIADGNAVCTNVLNTPIEPVTISPGVDTFNDFLDIEMSVPGDNVEIRYTLDGSEPNIFSPLYTSVTGKVRISDTTIVRARAYRKDTKGLDCTSASPIATAVYTKKALMPSCEVSSPKPGLRCDYYEGNWKKAFVSLDMLNITGSGYVYSLFDMSMKNKDLDYAFRYSGYLNIPTDDVYTFYAPYEYTHADIMEGYELNVYIDGELWYPATGRHAFGTWSVPLEAGFHTLRVDYADCRRDMPSFFNAMGSKKIMWDGTVPELEFSGPGIERRSIDDNLLYRE